MHFGDVESSSNTAGRPGPPVTVNVYFLWSPVGFHATFCRVFVPEQPEAGVAVPGIVVFFRIDDIKVSIVIKVDEKIDVKLDSLGATDVVNRPVRGVPAP